MLTVIGAGAMAFFMMVFIVGDWVTGSEKTLVASALHMAARIEHLLRTVW